MKETNETAAPPAAGRESLRRTVEEGYRRLAFGPVGDAVRLMLAEEGDWVDYPHLDLFNVAELRRGKGTMEMKFVSRLEALDRLAQLAREEESGGLESFCAALGQGARALYQGKEGEADAPAPE
ncbi:MAG: hypothetical protein HFF14_08765 [Angelakisella sp.]|jgi:hypothetical protein|nr:hypothetical protein [Angelakisella sp.]